MRQFLSDFLEDNIDELLILIFSSVAFQSPFVSDFLAEAGWNINHFYTGVFGQLIAIAMLLFRGKGKRNGKWEKVSKGLLSLFLGGSIAMVSAEMLGIESYGVLVFVGAAFQVFWDILMSYVMKLFPPVDSDKSANKADGGGDVDSGGGGN